MLMPLRTEDNTDLGVLRLCHAVLTVIVNRKPAHVSLHHNTGLTCWLHHIC
jgi:hypothetical protein